MILNDNFGRRFSYVRLSVTDACNFRCRYCLPNGYEPSTENPGFLSLNEIRNLVAGFAGLGAVKVRLTGGEPTLRRDLFAIARAVKETPGIQTVALSTNGFNLKKIAPRLLESGIDSVNVSVDSLDRGRFALHTGRDVLPAVRDGIDTCLALPFANVKVNAVLMATDFDREYANFQNFIQDRDLAVRFIELMPTGGNRDFFKSNHIKADSLIERLLRDGWRERARGENDGPAREFMHESKRGRIGVIAPYSEKFCANCNRLRVTSLGRLRLCLFGEGETSLRELLQTTDQISDLQGRIREILGEKEISHQLQQGRTGDNRTFSAMGG